MKFTSKIISKRHINNEIIILRFERKDLLFKAGQYIILSFPNEKEAREYSIYSGENDDYIEVLLKTVPDGKFSKRLGELSHEDQIQIEGPFGFFVMKDQDLEDKKHLFIATGTGISPFSSYIKSFPKLKYQLIHGIGLMNEQIEPENYSNKNLIYCISREKSAHFKGRVTAYLNTLNINKSTIYHLCGNSEMIEDVSDILEENGILPKNIRTEAFY
jgi:ferredoxin-NADP reductase